MNSYKKIVTPESKSALKKLFEESVVFKVCKMPLETAGGDVGVLSPKLDGLRAKWLFDRNGIYNSLVQYNSFPRRVQEYTYHGDFLHTLRQRINIIHEMISCDLDTFMPVHYSIRPRDPFLNKQLELNLNDSASISKFYVVTHPGQTRTQASVFLQSELKNTLLYINKKFFKNITLIGDGITQIKTPEQLVESYFPDFSVDETKGEWPSLDFDFVLPWHEGGLKRHETNETYIAKCNNINPSNYFADRRVSLHPTNKYSIASFIETDKFWNIFFNSKLNVYTSLESELKFTFHEQIYRLVAKLLGKDNFRDDSVGQFIYTMGYLDYENMETGNYWGELTSFDRLGSITQTYFTDKQRKYYESLLEEYKNFKISNTKLRFNILQSDIKSFEEYAKMNAYTGLCIVVNKHMKHRTITELLFCIPHNYALSRSEDNQIAIINCQHPYWQTKKDFKEYVFTEKFFNA